MRLIDADEAIKAVHDEFDGCLVWDESGETTADEVATIILQIPTIDPVKHGRWIPCNERLPEIGGTYIVTGIQKYAHEKEWHYFVDVASSHGDYIDDYWDTFNDWVEGQETHIVAWMPLPKPYKMDEVSE